MSWQQAGRLLEAMPCILRATLCQPTLARDVKDSGLFAAAAALAHVAPCHLGCECEAVRRPGCNARLRWRDREGQGDGEGDGESEWWRWK